MSDEPKRDWEKTWLHFFCGAVVGAGIGAYILFDSDWDNSALMGTALIVGSALTIGTLAGFFLDDFWDKFLDLFRWR